MARDSRRLHHHKASDDNTSANLVRAGGLYVRTRLPSMFRRATDYVDKILRRHQAWKISRGASDLI